VHGRIDGGAVEDERGEAVPAHDVSDEEPHVPLVTRCRPRPIGTVDRGQAGLEPFGGDVERLERVHRRCTSGTGGCLGQGLRPRAP
jgi:hypothetical protein